MLIQLYLLSQMRACELVERALRELGVDSSALDSARAAAERAGLENPGHPMDAYSALLGGPLRQVTTGDPDPHRRLAHYYQLPLWTDVLLSVFGSMDRQTSGVSFVAPSSRPMIVGLRPQDLRPWRQTEGQLAALLAHAKPLDEWYPQKDYECVLESPAGGTARHVLRFDFSLLQEVVPL